MPAKTGTARGGPRKLGIAKRLFPFLQWFDGYSATKLRMDLVAGLTVALVLVPQSMAYAQGQVPEVMVLDLKMPGIDGTQVLRQVKRLHPQVEVIILTGHGSLTDRPLAQELGAFAYLQKPVDIDLLTATMQQAYRKVEGAKRAASVMDGENGGGGQG